MNAHTFPTAQHHGQIERESLCHGCDSPRSSALEWCESCEDWTPSYQVPEPDASERDVVPASVVARYIAARAYDRIDRIAARRGEIGGSRG